MPKVVRIGSRKSKLALVQSEWVAKELSLKGIPHEMVLIESEGDQKTGKPLYQIESSGPGLFTKALETALLDNKIDIAVHSLKDLPTIQPSGLKVVCVPKREVANDKLLISPGKKDRKKELELAEGASLGTSSLRREAQFKAVRPDLKVLPLRGNVPTRVEAVIQGKVDAVVLAEAGLHRLALSPTGLVAVSLPPERFVSAPGQGALAIECRTEALFPEWEKALKSIHHEISFQEITIERTILRELEGGCTLPLGVKATFQGNGNYAVSAFLGINDKKDPHHWMGFYSYQTQGDKNFVVSDVVKYLRSCQ
jgi:hydroxymethylbilane synthase